MADDRESITEAEYGRKLIQAIQSVNDPQIIMQGIVDRSVTAARGEWSVRINGIEKAVDTAQENLVRVPTDVQKAVTSLRELLEEEIKSNTLRVAAEHEVIENEIAGDKQLYLEKFRSLEETIKVLKDTVNDRFVQNDANTEKAFNAAKQAVAERDTSNAKSAEKSETNLSKQISSLEANLKTLSETTDSRIQLNKTNTDDKVNDLKDRISRIESAKTGSGATIGLALGMIGGISGIFAVIGVIALLVRH